MMKRCPYCGQKIQVDAEQCEHCGKTLVKKKSDSTDRVGLTSIDSWEKKSVPGWVMYLVVALFVVFVCLMIVKGCEVEPEGQKKQENARRGPSQHPVRTVSDTTVANSFELSLIRYL